MSDNDNDQLMIRNQDTLHRRAWIDRALSGVRGRLHAHDEGEPGQAVQPPVPEAASLPAARPRLYLVRNRASR